jgi:hypothetical protein
VTDYFEHFDAILDTAETDPRPRWKHIMREMLENEIDRRQIPPDIAADIVRAPLHELADRLRRMLEEGRTGDAPNSISEFQLAVRRSVQNEREHGRLRTVTPTSELERCALAYRAHAWGGAEHDALVQMIKPGERIRSIDFWKIVTDTREITRPEIRAFGKPPWWSNKERSWESQFVSDREVIAAAETAQRQTNAIPAGSDSRNLDLPDPKRQWR